MAINVTLGEAKTQSEKPFPKLMIASKSTEEFQDRIVFFLEKNKGVCLVVGNSNNSFVGEYYEEWNMNVFEDYNGKITLQNE